MYTRRIVKGTLLAFWIFFMVGLAMLGASGEAYKYSEGPFSNIRGTYFADVNGVNDLSPSDQLQSYLNFKEHPPPIEAVLDQLLTDPGWSDRQLSNPLLQSSNDTGDTKTETEIQARRWRGKQYNQLFTKIERKLIAIASIRSIDPRNTSITALLIPLAFRRDGELIPKNVTLPEEAISWIEEERDEFDARKARRELLSTFLLLIVLGAFGSLIFLTRDYIAKEVKTSIAAYVFRPILGMFLAIAMFILDIFTHSIISTADMLEMRPEPLYLLALGAGLLSEQAYELVSLRAKAALVKFKEKKGL